MTASIVRAGMKRGLLLCCVAIEGCAAEPAIPERTAREAAVWALEQGGTIALFGHDRPLRGDDAIGRLPAGRFHIRVMDLSDASELADEGLVHLVGRTRLRELVLKNTPISDAGLKYLTTLDKITHLDLSGTPVTDAGLEHVGRLTSLIELNLSSTRVTGAGLTHLKGCWKLASLDLSDTEVTSVPVLYLAELTNLVSLNLCNTKVLDAPVAELRRALPYCKILRTEQADTSE